MTRIHTDQGRKEGIESASICAICGSKQRDLREEKALAGFDPTGHSENHIQAVVSTPFAAAHYVIHLYDMGKKFE